MERVRILLAEDHALVAEGFRRLLEPEFEVVGVAEDGRALLKAFRAREPDLLLLDVSLPLLNGLDAARRLRAASSVPIVILTMHGDPSLVHQAFRAGAQGYLLKTIRPAELRFALHEVLRGRRYVTPAVAGDVIDAAVAGHEPADFFAQLTARQREILQLVAEGKTLKDIAKVLEISVKTVEYHKTRLMKRLGLHSTAELARFAAARGLVHELSLNPLASRPGSLGCGGKF